MNPENVFITQMNPEKINVEKRKSKALRVCVHLPATCSANIQPVSHTAGTRYREGPQTVGDELLKLEMGGGRGFERLQMEPEHSMNR